MEIIQTIIDGLIIGINYVLLSLPLTLLYGILRIINFAHGEFLMLAAYITYWLLIFNLDIFTASILLVMIMGIFGMLIYLLTIKPIIEAPVLNQLLLTCGLSVFLASFAQLLWTGDYRSITLMPLLSTININLITISFIQLIILVSGTSIVALMYCFLSKTKTGKAIRAIIQDREAALLMGINVSHMYTLSFIISCIIAGIGGMMLCLTSYVYPYMGGSICIIAFCVVILGGIGSFTGTLIGGFILGLVRAFITHFIPYGGGWSEAVSFSILILILLLKPSGIRGGRI